MSQNANPLSASEPWNLVADGYAETTMWCSSSSRGRDREIGTEPHPVKLRQLRDSQL